ncbi:MAG: MFS transporter, partial [Kiritimatiellae bacterium]|nr:MFS transporter [Kiritimatiellia bacterium]
MLSYAQKLSRSFAWLNVTQFLGALNDNVFKLMLIYLLVNVMGEEHRTGIVALAFGLFVVPFLLFSHAAGVLADRISKRTIIVTVKFIEVAIMLMGCVAVLTQNSIGLFSILFLLGCHSTLFSPSKFGIIPELVPIEKLSIANSFIEGLTYIAIIIGTFLPSFFLKALGGTSFGLVCLCFCLACVGVVTSFGVEKTPAAGSSKKFSPWFLLEIFKTLKETSKDRHLFLAITGAAYFLFLGAFIQQDVLLYGQDCLGMDIEESGYLFPVAALGIGAGALLAGKLSGRNIEFGIVPIGALGLTMACVTLGLMPPSLKGTLVLITFIGVCCGLFIVPLNAFIQYRSPADRRGEILACTNFLSFLGVALSAGIFMLLNGVLGLTAGQCFVTVGVMTGILAAIAIVVLPDFLIRCVTVIITKCFYRINTIGLE